MTAICGLTKTFGQLFLARIGVGVGEAALGPAAFSMLSDYFPPKKLGRAIAVYLTGGSIGAGLALMMGAAVIAMVAELPQLTLPVIGSLKAWQLAFILVSLPGFLVVALMTTVKEPFRRDRMHHQGENQNGKVTSVPWRAGINYVASHWRTYLPFLAGVAVYTFARSAVIIWTPTLFIRTYGWTPSSIGYAFGLVVLVFAPLGTLIGGWLADYWRKHGYIDAGLRVFMAVAFLAAPIATLMPLMPTASWSLVLLAILMLLSAIAVAPFVSALQLVTPNQFRAQIMAFLFFVVNLLGWGLGPTVVALITDYVFHDDLALRYSVSIVSIIFMPLAAVIFWLGLKPYRDQVGQAE